jgi:hypothetical protein
MIDIQGINEAYERMLKGDVKYRFVIDMDSLKKQSHAVDPGRAACPRKSPTITRSSWINAARLVLREQARSYHGRQL